MIENGKDIDKFLNDKMINVIRNKDIPPKVKFKRVEHLVALGADVNVRKFGKSALSLALENEADESLVQFLKEKKAQEYVISKEEAYELGQLFWDSEGNLKSFSEVKELVERGADVNAVNQAFVAVPEKNSGYSILMVACQKKDNNDMIKYLVENGADVNFKNYTESNYYANYNTPFLNACYYGDKEILGYLLDKGADVNAIDSYGSSAAKVISIERDDNQCIDLIKMLIKRGYKIRNKDLSSAVFFRKPKYVQFFVDNGVDLRGAGTNWMFMCGPEVEKKEIREIFINNGFDVNTRNDKGWSLLSLGASVFNNAEAIEHILSLGADIELKNDIERTPLLITAQCKRKVNMECLIKKGANINQKDNDGNSALMLAVKDCSDDYRFSSGVEDNFRDVAEVLLKKGIDVNMVNNNGETALDVARKEEVINKGVIELLLQYGAKEGKEIEEKIEEKEEDIVVISVGTSESKSNQKKKGIWGNIKGFWDNMR